MTIVNTLLTVSSVSDIVDAVFLCYGTKSHGDNCAW